MSCVMRFLCLYGTCGIVKERRKEKEREIAGWEEIITRSPGNLDVALHRCSAGVPEFVVYWFIVNFPIG